MQRDYSPYGEVVTAAGNDETAYQFSGKEKDLATGFGYFGARYYYPGIGRWLVPDPAGQGWSPYAYCANQPVVMVDPDGRNPLLIGALFMGAYSAGSAYIDNQDIGSAFVTGAITSLVTAGVGSAFNAAYQPSGFWATVGYKSLGGATSGVISATMTGGSVGYAAIQGAAMGGMTAAFDYWDMSIKADVSLLKADYDPGQPVNATDPALTEFIDKNETLSGLRTNAGNPEIKVATNQNLTNGMKLKNGFIKHPMEGNVLGYTEKISEWSFGHFNSSIRIAPKAFATARALYMTVGHEYNHAISNYTGRYAKWFMDSLGNRERASRISEYHALEWNVSQSINANELKYWTTRRDQFKY